MESDKPNQEIQKQRTVLTSIKPFLFLCAGFGITAFSISGMMGHGFYFAGRGNPEQLEGGLYPLLFVIGLAVVVYGGIEFWLNRK